MMWGFLLGAAAGFGLALWRAPRSGDATRQQLTEMGLELKRRAQQSTDGARQQAQTTAGPALQRAEHLVARAEDVIGTLGARGRSLLDERRHVVHDNGHD